jgi:8-oxo-dGTP pyrophosphatase MutT (NUDIX family)/phosphohistidine phosphatase SixA
LSGIVAAGTVLWRTRQESPDDSRSGDGGIDIALVHRPRYDDWSLPKGKCEPGENPCVTAVRETLEETGYTGTLTRGLGRVEYDISDANGISGSKVVHYWAMRALDGEFIPNAEVDKIRWLRPDEALGMLSRKADRKPVAAFLGGPAAPVTLLLIRHADAGDQRDWPGTDETRPLNEHGRQQAENLAKVGACFGPTSVLTADITRCVQTVTPLAIRLGLSVESDPLLSEITHAYAPGAALKRIRKLVAGGRHLAVCSQGGVIPDVLDTLRRQDGVALAPRARKGSMWVLSFAGTKLVAAQYLPDSGPAL